MKKALFITIISLIILSCQKTSTIPIEKNELLKASREAQLGWVYLTIYEDSTFQFVLTGIGLRDSEVYPGKVKIVNDSLYFSYTDRVPKAGNTAIIKNKMVIYTKGKYYERLEIGQTKIRK